VYNVSTVDLQLPVSPCKAIAIKEQCVMTHLHKTKARLLPLSGRFIAVFIVLTTVSAVALHAQAPRSSTIAVTPTESGAVVSASVDGPGAGYHPSRVLVKFHSGVRDFLPGSGNARSFPLDQDLFLVSNPPDLSVAEVVARYKANPNVVYSEPDFEVHAVATPNDPLFNAVPTQQWDMVKIAAPTAWNLPQTDASDIVVAIIDTGIDYTHADLTGNLWADPTNPAVHGFTCIGGSCVAGGLDDFGHGTHVAGTIGAVTDNGVGMAGINWKVKLLSLKFLNSSGSGNISDAVLAFNKVVQLKAANAIVNNIRITSNSWGGGGFSQALKDAMAQVEAAGVLDVCAAGNSGQNADASPMYPAAYDNRGIVSVLASDSNDAGASFTNYGLASVDIAAPGVSTLSTVPTGSCTLCDVSGYKLLSGTSMATPHVSGVMAALFHLHPSLAAAEARDIVLDPLSYDTATLDAKAKSTSSGGRLNFPKTLANPRLGAPIVLNNFPTVTMGPDAFAAAGTTVNLTATPADADGGDVAGLRTAWAKSVSTGSQWLYGWILSSLFPNPSGSTATFTAPSTAPGATVAYDASVADNRGGGAHGRSWATVLPAASPGTITSGALTASPASGPVGQIVTVGFPLSDPDPHTMAPAWDVWAAGLGGASGFCCNTGSSFNLQFNGAGVYRVSAMGIDQELNLSSRPSQVVRIGTPTPTGEPPIAAVSLSRRSGTVPFSVTVDMSGSVDPDAAVAPGIQYYFINCGGGGFTAGQTTAQATCTFTDPGVYWLLLQVQDFSGQMDIISAYVSAAPAAGPADNTNPTVNITAPAPGSTVSGVVNITATATDNVGGSGVNRVEFRLDGAAGTLLNSDSVSPYAATWNSSTATPGSAHSIYAIAYDNAGNSDTKSINVTVAAVPPPPPPPTITTNPLPNAIARKASVTITATDSVAVAKVDFYVGSTLTCTDSTPSDGFTCNWKVPAAPNKTYSLTAIATDSYGQPSPPSSATTVSPK
jgi:subtilisin family serine protease